jgi:hypothetical protein
MTVFQPKLTLSPKDITCIASLRRPGIAGRRIGDLVPEMLELVRAENLLAPQFIFVTRRMVAQMAGNILLEDRTTIHAPLVAGKLPGAQHLAIGLCTIGADLGEWVSGLFAARKGFQALVLDEIGNAAVQKLARRAHAQIRRHARAMNLTASSALSPGAAGFSTDQQAGLCRLVSGERIGVRIRGGVMMQPGKSLSFVMGLGEDMPRWRQDEDCRSCRAADHCRNRVDSAGALL